MRLQHMLLVMRVVRLLAFLVLVSAASTVFAQQVDYIVWFESSGLPIAGSQWIKGLVVKADRWTEAKESFVVRVTVPPELEFRGAGNCDGNASYDEATRVLTWSGRVTNPYGTSCPLELLVAPTLLPGSRFTLVAALTTATPDLYPGNNTMTLTGIVPALADIEVSISVDAVKVRPGATLEYMLTMTNRGPHDGQSVILTDTFSPDVEFVSFEQVDGPPGVIDPKPLLNAGSCSPSSCGGTIRGNIGIVPSGSSATYRLVVKMKPGIEAARISNRVSVQSTSLDLSNQNNTKELLVSAGPVADLAVVERLGEDAAGGLIPITVEVSNDGPDTVNAVTVNNYLEPRDGYFDSYESHETLEVVSATPSRGTCSAPQIVSFIGCPAMTVYWKVDCAIGALAPGARATITLMVNRGTRHGRFTHRAFVSPDQNDSKPANNGSEIFVDASAPRKRAVRR